MADTCSRCDRPATWEINATNNMQDRPGTNITWWCCGTHLNDELCRATEGYRLVWIRRGPGWVKRRWEAKR